MKTNLIRFGTVCLLFLISNAAASVLYVNLNSANPVSPYTNWSTAATNIQDAIDVSTDGDLILVTNGVYQSGGRTMAGNLTNRIALNKAVTVQSVNGYSTTVIQGAWDPISTNGPGAVRCAYLTNGAVLNGFTLKNGATLTGGFVGDISDSGGGIFCDSTNAVVSNCVLTNNSSVFGGGICHGTLNNSLVIGNLAAYGGGAHSATLNNCTVIENIIPWSSFAYERASGTHNCTVRNSIVLDNYTAIAPGVFSPGNNYYYDSYYGPFSVRYIYSCTDPLISGAGNIDINPQFLDSFHIASTSPCRSAGSTLYASGTDLDGEPWINPPSIGCDEIVDSNFVGPLSVSLNTYQTNLLVNQFTSFSGHITGRASHVEWSFGDGIIATNLGTGASHRWTNAGDYSVIFTAYNNDNPAGVSTNIVVYVRLPDAPQLQSPALLPNGFQFQFTGQISGGYSVQYTVQYATNLMPPVTWQTLQTVDYNDGGVIQINDPASTNTTRFYRVLAQ